MKQEKLINQKSHLLLGKNNATTLHQQEPCDELIGAIDQGTSSTRFLVFEKGGGHLIASSQLEIKRITPKEGWVEIDPNAIMSSVYATMANVHDQLVAKHLIEPRDGDNDEQHLLHRHLLKCIGICNQRESTVVWDSITGQPLYNVIVWMDNRTKDIVDDMIDSIPGRDFNRLKDKTGLPMSTYFSAFKLRWLIDNVDDVRRALDEKRLLFGTVDSWILWNLTGKHLTDVTNASRTFLMDIETLEWDKMLCNTFKVPLNILPKIMSSADEFGHIQFGPFMGTPITGVIGDQSAALFGHNCLQLGQTKATFGTGCFIMQNIGPGPLNGALAGVQRQAKRGLITTVGYKLKDKPVCYALEGSVKIAGAALTWLRDNMQLIQNYEECDQLVNMTTHSAGVFFVPALGGLYSPYWDPNAAGLFIGLSQFTRREHLVRATFDSIAYQTNDILSLMHGVTNGLMIDGGLCKSDNLCQILADITGCDINRPAMCETSALGAAMVAGCGAGVWSYESMLARSNASHDNVSAVNQTHHYPHESLHYESNKLSPLINQSKMSNFKRTCSHQQHQNGTNGYKDNSARQKANASDQDSTELQLSKHQRRLLRHRTGNSAQQRIMRNLDAGGGINDDAGGGGGRSDDDDDDEHVKRPVLLQNNGYSEDDADDDDEDEEEEEGDAESLARTLESNSIELIVSSSSSASCSTTIEETMESREAQRLQQQVSSAHKTRVLLQAVAPASSGYSSGDNFESVADQFSSVSQHSMRVDSPTSQTTDAALSERDSAVTCTDATTIHSFHQSYQANTGAHLREASSQLLNDEKTLVARTSTPPPPQMVVEHQNIFVANAETVADDVHEFGGRDSYGEDGYDSSTVSFDSYCDGGEFAENDNELDASDQMKARRDDAHAITLHGDIHDHVNDNEDDNNDDDEEELVKLTKRQHHHYYNGHNHNHHHYHHHHHHHHHNHNEKRKHSSGSVDAIKQMDIFQSYISLEHRTDLVNTWRLAVGRSMQWTKVHHEEIRRIDYQRLSSLPISMYVFFSIGMVALSGFFSTANPMSV